MTLNPGRNLASAIAIFSIGIITSFFSSGGEALAQVCAAPPQGMIAWWPFDENDGIIAHDRQGIHDGAHTNGPLPAEGKVGGSLRFDGSDDYVTVPDNDVWAFGSANFTIEFWASFDVPGGGTINHPGDIFIGNDEGPGVSRKWFFALGGGTLNFHIIDPNGVQKFIPRPSFSPIVGEWYHLAITRSGSTYTIFVNGTPVGSAVDSGLIPNPNAPLTIGQAEQLGFMNGRLDEVTVYNRALSNEELQSIVGAGSAGKCKDLQIRPSAGGDTGIVSVVINGNGFLEGATARLAKNGEPNIVGDPVIVGGGGLTVNATFDLRGKTRGTWDVVVENPDATAFTLPEGFTIEEGREANLWAEVVGLGVIRPGRPQTYHVFYGNRGNVNAIGVPITLAGIPIDATVTPTLDLGTVPSVDGEPEISPDDVPLTILNGDGLSLPFFDPVVPPGEVRNFSVRLNVPQGSSEFSLRAWANSFASGPLLQKLDSLQCVTDVIREFLPPNVSCVADVTDEMSQLLFEIIFTKKFREKTTYAQVVAGLLNSCTNVLEKFEDAKVAVDYVNFVTDPPALIPDSCVDLIPPGVLSGLLVAPIASFDPNDKIGSKGTGIRQYLSIEEPLRYVIQFENVETATAPAQEVIITDQLDAAKMDLTTLSLGPIAFGPKIVTPPQGVSSFTTDVDLRPDNDIIVRIEAGLNQNTGLLTWRLTGLDLITGDLPDDPLAGFLPPNITPPEGEGSVLFTVIPKAGLPTDTEVTNAASIIFDVNVPIVTAVWSNLIDNSNPESAVLPLAATQRSTDFLVEWAGTDEGAGIQDYSIFVSEDGGPFSAAFTNIPDTSRTFSGKDGGTYEFYSVARDLAGNLEEVPVFADAITRVQLVNDSDNDGVPNSDDLCPQSNTSPTVVIQQCDSGVPNVVLSTPRGCTITDEILKLAVGAKNQGQFMSRLDKFLLDMQKTGILLPNQKGPITACAAKSSLP